VLVPQLSIHLVNFSPSAGDWTAMVDRARLADEVGIDRVVASDHVAFGERLDAYADPSLGGTEGGRQPTGPDGHWLDPLTVLSFVTPDDVAKVRHLRCALDMDAGGEPVAAGAGSSRSRPQGRNRRRR
jgi:hypothetical protein